MLHQLQFALLCYRLIVRSFHEVELTETRFNSWLAGLDFPQKNIPKSGQKLARNYCIDGLVCPKFGEKNAASASICAPPLLYYVLIVRSFHEVKVTEIDLTV